MKNNSAKILKQRIVDSQIYVDREIDDNLELQINCKANLKSPKDSKEKSVLLNIQLNIISEEKMKISLDADVVFGLEMVIDDYDDIAEQQLIPMACESVLKSLDDILVVMGYSRLELGEKLKSETFAG